MAPQVKPVGGVSVRETTPAKPFWAETVIVEVAEVPMWTAAGDDAAIVKSWTVKVNVTVFVVNPELVPVTVTV
jgi:hypothetical protein